MIECLDHGFVELVDSMGSDQAIVDAARVSISGEGVQKKTNDYGLIRYLMRNGHTTPFEMVELKFHVKLPIFVARQWVRHRTANINEMSGRYSELPNEVYQPEKLYLQSQVNKQGRDEGARLDESDELTLLSQLSEDCSAAFDTYGALLDHDVTREVARIGLPLSTYTQWIWKIDLHNLFHFLSLRLDPHAQYEIRVYAEAIAELVKPIVPVAWEAFEDFRLEAKRFSKSELIALSEVLAKLQEGEPVGESTGITHFKTHSEHKAFIGKLKELI